MNFDFTQFLVLDALVAAGVVVGALAFVYTIGKYSIVPAIAAVFTGASFAALAPYVGRMPGAVAWPEYQQKILAFAVVMLVAFFVYRRHEYFDPRSIPNGIEVVICGLLLAGSVLAILGAFLPSDVLANTSPQLQAIFAGDVMRSLWLASPILVFGAMRGR